jgi:hypothetical protein
VSDQGRGPGAGVRPAEHLSLGGGGLGGGHAGESGEAAESFGDSVEVTERALTRSVWAVSQATTS